LYREHDPASPSSLACLKKSTGVFVFVIVTWFAFSFHCAFREGICENDIWAFKTSISSFDLVPDFYLGPLTSA
jgi:hypothetical protein